MANYIVEVLTHKMKTHSISKTIIKAIKNGNRVFVCGNGGSADMSNHFATELVGKFEKERRALPVMSLVNDISTITAIANDYGYSDIFVRQLEAHAKIGDVLITLSTSGTSGNVLKAISYAKVKGLKVYSFPTRGNMSTAECQETHLKLLHRISREVEDAFA